MLLDTLAHLWSNRLRAMSKAKGWLTRFLNGRLWLRFHIFQTDVFANYSIVMYPKQKGGGNLNGHLRHVQLPTGN